MKKRISFLGLGILSTIALASCGKVKIDYPTSFEWNGIQTATVDPDEDVDGNLLGDGTFSDTYKASIGTNYEGIGSWGLLAMDGGKCHAGVTPDRQLSIYIEKYATVDYSCQLNQKGIGIGKGSSYRIAFDIYAEVPQSGDCIIQKDGSPYTAYFKESFKITTEKQHFEYTWDSDVTDASAAFVFNLGRFPGESNPQNIIYVDNIELICTKDSGVLDKPKTNVLLNQVGYFTNGQKTAVFRGKSIDSTFVIKDYETNEVVYNGTVGKKVSHQDLRYEGVSASAEDRYSTIEGYVADFSDFTTPGKYYIEGEKCGKSHSFVIGDTVYNNLYESALNFFYLQRCGQETEDEIFGHKACHETCKEATVYGTTEKIDVSGGWHDAGDYGKYVVAGVKAVEDLFIAYEKSGNSALIEEAKYELDWMVKMQNAKGEVYHKVTTAEFPDLAKSPVADIADQIVSPVSYAATADFAAIMARAAKIYASDAELAASYKAKSLKAYEALATMSKTSFKNPTDITTGEYPDSVLNDELGYASMALYDLTGDVKYMTAFEGTVDKKQDVAYGWDNMTAYAYRLYIQNPAASRYSEILGLMTSNVNKIIENMNSCPYTDPISGTHSWGSNLVVCGDAMLMMDVAAATGDDYSKQYQDLLDYLLGKNITDYSYVTGFGDNAASHPHHRLCLIRGYSIPGMLVGGPNNDYANNGGDGIATAKCKRKKVAPEEAYVDDSGAYSLNEVTIYWNSPLMVLLSDFYK